MIAKNHFISLACKIAIVTPVVTIIAYWFTNARYWFGTIRYVGVEFDTCNQPTVIYRIRDSYVVLSDFFDAFVRTWRRDWGDLDKLDINNWFIFIAVFIALICNLKGTRLNAKR